MYCCHTPILSLLCIQVGIYIHCARIFVISPLIFFQSSTTSPMSELSCEGEVVSMMKEEEDQIISFTFAGKDTEVTGVTAH